MPRLPALRSLGYGRHEPLLASIRTIVVACVAYLEGALQIGAHPLVRYSNLGASFACQQGTGLRMIGECQRGHIGGLVHHGGRGSTRHTLVLLGIATANDIGGPLREFKRRQRFAIVLMMWWNVGCLH